MNGIVVIPTYNEKENITQLIDAIASLNIAGLSILVVDDNSPDGTAEVVKNHATTIPVELLERESKQGLGTAYVAGFTKALKQAPDYIIQMDADFSHAPSDIPRLLDAMNNADLAIGSRKIPGGKVVGWGPIRTFMSAGAMWFSRLLLGLKTKDVTAGFRCYSRNVLESIGLESINSNGYAFQEEMLFRTEAQGFSVKEIPVTFTDRRAGKSKLSKKDIVEFFTIIWRLRKLKK